MAVARRALGPATLAVVQAVEGAVAPSETMLVACSGGADSLALAAGAAVVSRRRQRGLLAVCVDHGLQQDSAAVARGALEQLAALGIAEARIVPVTVVASHPGGPEAAAREARYTALDGVAGDHDAVVLLGHTRDDQAETVLLGLARGSGQRSLAGMPVRRGRFVRPLLALPRAITRRACTELGLQPWSDPHNTDPTYARVRVRERVLPVLEEELGPGVAAALARTADLVRDDADLLDALAAAADPGTSDLPVAALVDLAPALRRRVIRRWLQREGAVGPGYRHIADVERLVVDWHGQQGIDVPGVRVRRTGGRLFADVHPSGQPPSNATG